jgi:serine/threonine protein kinase
MICSERDRDHSFSGVESVPKLINVGYEKLSKNSAPWTRWWLMIEAPAGIRLDDYLSNETIRFVDKLRMILALIDSVQRIHQRRVVHRNLTPSKIYVHFDTAHISLDGPHQGSNETNLLPNDSLITNHFYCPAQFQAQPLNYDDIHEEQQPQRSERQSPTIDTSYICATLFWMITCEEPEVARNLTGQPPHCVPSNKQLIEDTLKKATSERTALTNGCQNRRETYLF